MRNLVAATSIEDYSTDKSTEKCRQRFNAQVIRDKVTGQSLQALLVFLKMAISNQTPKEIRTACLHLLEGYFLANPEAQLAAVSTFIPAPSDEDPQTIGSSILKGLFDFNPDSETSLYSAQAFCRILHCNPQAQAKASLQRVTLQVSDWQGEVEEAEPTIPANIFLALQCLPSLSSVVKEGFWLLLCALCCGNPLCICQLLEQPQATNFLTQQLLLENSLPALLFFICLVWSPEESKERLELLAVFHQRIGLPKAKKIIQKIKSQPLNQVDYLIEEFFYVLDEAQLIVRGKKGEIVALKQENAQLKAKNAQLKQEKDHEVALKGALIQRLNELESSEEESMQAIGRLEAQVAQLKKNANISDIFTL